MTLDSRWKTLLRDIDNKINFALDMPAVFGKHQGALFPLFNVHKIFVLTFKSSFLLFVYDSRSTKVSMITFVGGSKFAKGGPNPLANMDSLGSKSARTPDLL